MSATISTFQIPLTTVTPTFAPATFVEVGHSLYRDPSTGLQNLLVESSQSVANLMEATCLSGEGQLKPELAGLSHVNFAVTLPDGQISKVSSLELPHRLGSGWLCSDAKDLSSVEGLADWREGLIKELIFSGTALATFKRCPNTVLHGVFYSHLEGVKQLPKLSKLAGLVTGSILASNVVAVTDGGVAFDPIAVSGKGLSGEDTAKYSATGRGSIPYSRYSFTAESIRLEIAFFIGRLNKLRLPEEAKKLLIALVKYQLANLLAEPIDLRSRCVFTVEEVPVLFNDLDKIISDLQQAIEACTKAKLLMPVQTFELSLKESNGKKLKKGSQEAANGND